MKRTKLLLLILAILMPMIASADAVEIKIDGIYYNLVSNDKTAEVTENPNKFSEGNYSGSVTIPATVTYGGEQYSVTSIGSHAFDLCNYSKQRNFNWIFCFLWLH